MGGSFAETDEDDVSTLSGELAVFIVVDAALLTSYALRRSTCCGPAARSARLSGLSFAGSCALLLLLLLEVVHPFRFRRLLWRATCSSISSSLCSYCPGASCSTRARPRWARVRWRACSSSGGCGSSGRSAPRCR